MFRLDACSVLHSNNSKDPAGPVGDWIPCRFARVATASLDGTPTVCACSDCVQLFSGVTPAQGMKYSWDPGISISGPLKALFSVSMIEALTARMAGMPSSVCQVSKSECHSKPLPQKPALLLIRDW